MARPTKFDRSEAVAAAMNEIWREGYETSSVKRLSEVLGITRSSFYNAFHSREDLLREAVAAYLALTPSRPSMEPGGASILSRLTGFVRAMCRFHAENGWRGCMIANSLAAACSIEEGLGAEASDRLHGAVEHFAALLDHARAQGEIPADSDTHVLAMAFQNLLTGLGVFGKAVRSEDELWAMAEVTLRGLGLYAQPAAGGDAMTTDRLL